MALTHDGPPTNDGRIAMAHFNTSTTMMLVPMVAVAAATLGLTVSSVRNMAQTYKVSRKQQELDHCLLWTPPANAHEAVSQLQAMKRKELLELFLSCEAPSNVSEIYGEWNGSLLENNGWILVKKESHY